MSLLLEPLPMAGKFRRLALEVTTEKGEFALFGLFYREDAPNVWDLVVSAPWMDRNEMAALRYLAKKLRHRLRTRELVSLSRIVVRETGNPGVRALRKALPVRGQVEYLTNFQLFGLSYREAYIMVSQDPRKPLDGSVGPPKSRRPRATRKAPPRAARGTR
jgi:hypothetical protein